MFPTFQDQQKMKQDKMRSNRHYELLGVKQAKTYWQYLVQSWNLRHVQDQFITLFKLMCGMYDR